jgi:hypothetical protein
MEVAVELYLVDYSLFLHVVSWMVVAERQSREVQVVENLLAVWTEVVVLAFGTLAALPASRQASAEDPLAALSIYFWHTQHEQGKLQRDAQSESGDGRAEAKLEAFPRIDRVPRCQSGTFLCASDA